ncbi:MAG TPA: cytochrome o ubiquinol oxidase subunit IV [Rhodocyclaceae bacterium]
MNAAGDSDNRQGRQAGHDENDRAPGIVEEARTPGAAARSYAIGLALSIALTVASFYVLGTRLVWAPAIPVALLVLAVAQIGVHLVFFLHITTAPDNTNNVLALAFGVLIVGLILAGSLWIMAHLDRNMMPMR